MYFFNFWDPIRNALSGSSIRIPSPASNFKSTLKISNSFAIQFSIIKNYENYIPRENEGKELIRDNFTWKIQANKINLFLNKL